MVGFKSFVGAIACVGRKNGEYNLPPPHRRISVYEEIVYLGRLEVRIFYIIPQFIDHFFRNIFFSEVLHCVQEVNRVRQHLCSGSPIIQYLLAGKSSGTLRRKGMSMHFVKSSLIFKLIKKSSFLSEKQHLGRRGKGGAKRSIFKQIRDTC